jgi:hypothetical protein
MDLFLHLPLQEMIRLRRSGEVCDETLLGALAPKMVERQVGGDPPRPGREVTVRPEAVARSVNPPESLHCQILRDTWVTHDADDPCVDLALKLPDQCLERIDLAKRKSPEQSMDLSILYYVARRIGLQGFARFGERRVRLQMIQTAASDRKAPQCRIRMLLRP